MKTDRKNEEKGCEKKDRNGSKSRKKLEKGLPTRALEGSGFQFTRPLRPFLLFPRYKTYWQSYEHGSKKMQKKKPQISIVLYNGQNSERVFNHGY
ncbi:hypothetical protein IMZ31_22955 (plasmid) [Pontibacillus sp. ALD_SL1]|nr:hypothetical protein IMZ31_22955 [Pontibacillus sp. ALD_SL1]